MEKIFREIDLRTWFRRLRIILLVSGLSIVTISCKETANAPCGCEGGTIQRFENVKGTVSRFDTLYYIKLHLPDNEISIETCGGLADEMKQEGLEVIMSGELKILCPSPMGNPNTKIFSPHPFAVKSIEISI